MIEISNFVGLLPRLQFCSRLHIHA